MYGIKVMRDFWHMITSGWRMAHWGDSTPAGHADTKKWLTPGEADRVAARYACWMMKQSKVQGWFVQDMLHKYHPEEVFTIDAAYKRLFDELKERWYDADRAE